MIVNSINKQQVFDFLAKIPDPEIPVITIEELGILRDVEMTGNICTITITPTYTGCPAMRVIEDDIKSVLKEKGIENVKIIMVYSPAWTTDWMSNAVKEKLRKYGIAPPEHSFDKNSLTGKPKVVLCPQCGSSHTQMTSQFGSTACKALYKCLDCKEPFDYFKCL